MVKFCPSCGKQLPFENAEICPNCGIKIKPSSPKEREGSKTAQYIIIGIVVFFGLIIAVAIFSYVILGAGFFTASNAQQSTPSTGSGIVTTPRTQVTVYKGVEKATSNIQMIGNVYGLASSPSAGINEIKFIVGLAPGAPSNDLTKLKIVFSTPSTTPVIYTQGNVPSTSIFTTKLNGVTAVKTINANDQIEVDFKVVTIKPNTKINIEIRPSVGAALPFSKTAPATISATNVLY